MFKSFLENVENPLEFLSKNDKYYGYWEVQNTKRLSLEYDKKHHTQRKVKFSINY